MSEPTSVPTAAAAPVSDDDLGGSFGLNNNSITAAGSAAAADMLRIMGIQHKRRQKALELQQHKKMGTAPKVEAVDEKPKPKPKLARATTFANLKSNSSQLVQSVNLTASFAPGMGGIPSTPQLPASGAGWAKTRLATQKAILEKRKVAADKQSRAASQLDGDDDVIALTSSNIDETQNGGDAADAAQGTAPTAGDKSPNGDGTSPMSSLNLAASLTNQPPQLDAVHLSAEMDQAGGLLSADDESPGAVKLPPRRTSAAAKLHLQVQSPPVKPFVMRDFFASEDSSDEAAGGVTNTSFGSVGRNKANSVAENQNFAVDSEGDEMGGVGTRSGRSRTNTVASVKNRTPSQRRGSLAASMLTGESESDESDVGILAGPPEGFRRASQAAPKKTKSADDSFDYNLHRSTANRGGGRKAGAAFLEYSDPFLLLPGDRTIAAQKEKLQQQIQKLDRDVHRIVVSKAHDRYVSKRQSSRSPARRGVAPQNIYTSSAPEVRDRTWRPHTGFFNDSGFDAAVAFEAKKEIERNDFLARHGRERQQKQTFAPSRVGSLGARDLPDGSSPQPSSILKGDRVTTHCEMKAEIPSQADEGRWHDDETSQLDEVASQFLHAMGVAVSRNQSSSHTDAAARQHHRLHPAMAGSDGPVKLPSPASYISVPSCVLGFCIVEASEDDIVDSQISRNPAGNLDYFMNPALNVISDLGMETLLSGSAVRRTSLKNPSLRLSLMADQTSTMIPEAQLSGHAFLMEALSSSNDPSYGGRSEKRRSDESILRHLAGNQPMGAALDSCTFAHFAFPSKSEGTTTAAARSASPLMAAPQGVVTRTDSGKSQRQRATSAVPVGVSFAPLTPTQRGAASVQATPQQSLPTPIVYNQTLQRYVRQLPCIQHFDVSDDGVHLATTPAMHSPLSTAPRHHTHSELPSMKPPSTLELFNAKFGGRQVNAPHAYGSYLNPSMAIATIDDTKDPFNDDDWYFEDGMGKTNSQEKRTVPGAEEGTTTTNENVDPVSPESLFFKAVTACPVNDPFTFLVQTRNFTIEQRHSRAERAAAEAEIARAAAIKEAAERAAKAHADRLLQETLGADSDDATESSSGIKRVLSTQERSTAHNRTERKSAGQPSGKPTTSSIKARGSSDGVSGKPTRSKVKPSLPKQSNISNVGAKVVVDQQSSGAATPQSSTKNLIERHSTPIAKRTSSIGGGALSRTASASPNKRNTISALPSTNATTTLPTASDRTRARSVTVVKRKQGSVKPIFESVEKRTLKSLFKRGSHSSNNTQNREEKEISSASERNNARKRASSTSSSITVNAAEIVVVVGGAEGKVPPAAAIRISSVSAASTSGTSSDSSSSSSSGEDSSTDSSTSSASSSSGDPFASQYLSSRQGSGTALQPVHTTAAVIGSEVKTSWSNPPPTLSIRRKTQLPMPTITDVTSGSSGSDTSSSSTSTSEMSDSDASSSDESQDSSTTGGSSSSSSNRSPTEEGSSASSAVSFPPRNRYPTGFADTNFGSFAEPQSSFASPSDLSWQNKKNAKNRDGPGAVAMAALLGAADPGRIGRVPSRRGIDESTGQVILGATNEEAEAEIIFQQLNAGELVFDRENEAELALISRYMADVNGAVLERDASSPAHSASRGSPATAPLHERGLELNRTNSRSSYASDASETPLERLIKESSQTLDRASKWDLASKLSSLRSSKNLKGSD